MLDTGRLQIWRCVAQVSSLREFDNQVHHTHTHTHTHKHTHTHTHTEIHQHKFTHTQTLQMWFLADGRVHHVNLLVPRTLYVDSDINLLENAPRAGNASFSQATPGG